MSDTVSERTPGGEASPAERPPEARQASALPPPRVGVVLAAGLAERLASVTGGGSKALVRVGGITLIERAVRGLLAEGLERVVVVVGYQAGPVAAVVDRLAPGRVRAALSEHWELGNGSSLAAAEPYLEGERSFVLVTSDHVFEPGALTPLVRAGRPGVLVDHEPDPEAWAEWTRVRLVEDGDTVVAFSKELEEPAIDCGAFLLPIEVFDAQRRAAARGDGSLAGVVTEFAATEPLAAVPLPNGSRWQDVDTPEDLRRVSRLLREWLTKGADGPVSRYLNRPVSSRISMAIAHLPISPDAVSVIACAVGIVAAIVLGAGAGIAGGLLVHLASVLDGVDGEIARLKVRSSAWGALFDGMLDRFADAAIVAGLAVWALAPEEHHAATTVVVVAAFAATGSMLSMASKDRIAALRLPQPPERGISLLLGGRDARLLVVAIGAVAGEPLAALIVITATSLASLVVRLALVRSTFRAGRRGVL